MDSLSCVYSALATRGCRRCGVRGQTELLLVYLRAKDEGFGTERQTWRWQASGASQRDAARSAQRQNMRVVDAAEGGALAPTSADTRPHYLRGCYGKDVSRIPLPAKTHGCFFFFLLPLLLLLLLLRLLLPPQCKRRGSRVVRRVWGVNSEVRLPGFERIRGKLAGEIHLTRKRLNLLFHLQRCPNSSWRAFAKVMELFFRDFGPSGHDSVTAYASAAQLISVFSLFRIILCKAQRGLCDKVPLMFKVT